MALTKRTRFILVQSTSNTNVTDDNMEPYHVSIFRRSTSMPPLPVLSSAKKIDSLQCEQQPQQQQSMIIPKCRRRQKDETLANKFYKLNIHAMKKKSARISMRLSSAFGLSTYTVDEQFNFQEQQFHSIEKFAKLFLRNAYSCIEALRESFITQVDVAEDFEELLMDKKPDLAQQFLRSKRSLLENIFTEFSNHIDVYVIQPISNLLKLFVKPTNLISKRHKKLLDYDSAQSTYEKVKDHQLRQAKQALDLSKQTYESLNNQLLEELPILYECSRQIISISLKEFVRGHLLLMQQMKINIQFVLNQIILPTSFQQLNWQQILDRFMTKYNSTYEGLYQLTITSKNFSDKIKHLPTTQMSLLFRNHYNYDKEALIQTDETRHLLKTNFPEQDLFIVLQDYISNSCNTQSANSISEIIARDGDLVVIVNQCDKNSTNQNWLVDNGVTRGYLPRSILMPYSSTNGSGSLSLVPQAPIRHDISSSTNISSCLANSTLNHNPSSNNSARIDAESNLCLINSSHGSTQENECIYLNQVHHHHHHHRLSNSNLKETHQYASIDLNESTTQMSTKRERIYVALYDFNFAIDGVLSLHVGERVKVLQHSDDDKNEEWWYVEKIDDTRQRGYVPANYIQAISE